MRILSGAKTSRSHVARQRRLMQRRSVPFPAIYGAARRAHAFLAHSSLIGAAEVRAELEAALSKAGGVE